MSRDDHGDKTKTTKERKGIKVLIRRMGSSQVQGDVLVLYVYQLRTDPNGLENVAVEKVSFRKASA